MNAGGYRFFRLPHAFIVDIPHSHENNATATITAPPSALLANATLGGTQESCSLVSISLLCMCYVYVRTRVRGGVGGSGVEVGGWIGGWGVLGGGGLLSTLIHALRR